MRKIQEGTNPNMQYFQNKSVRDIYKITEILVPFLGN